MFRETCGVIAVVLLLGAAAVAQQPAPAAPKPTPAPAAPKPTPPPAAAPTMVDTGMLPGGIDPRGQPVNVKLDLTITDQLGPGEPAKKTMSLIVADRAGGSIRSSGNNVRAVLNVDATPQIMPNGNIRVQLGLEYNPRQSMTVQTAKGPSGETVQLPPEPGGSSLNQRVAIVLEPGKPLVLSQAADPISDRRITVEIRATVLK